MASEPFEIQLSGADIYLAPLGEPFPAVEDAPAGNWALLADAEHISEAGILINGNIGTTLIRTLGSVAAVKAGIQTRDFNVEFEVLDASAEAQALALGLDPADNTVGVQTVLASGAEAGYRSLEIPTSPTPQGFSLLMRWGQSAYGDGANSQYEISSGVQIGGGGGIFSKTTPFGMKHTWAALNTGSGFVRLVEQDDSAS